MPPEESSRSEGKQETSDWSDTFAYGGRSGTAIPEDDTESDHWSRWHYGVYLGAALLLVGVFRGSLFVLVTGYLLVPVTMYLDSRYLESVTTGWQPDVGLYVIGSLLFPVLMIPAYLYRRRELRGSE